MPISLNNAHHLEYVVQARQSGSILDSVSAKSGVFIGVVISTYMSLFFCSMVPQYHRVRVIAKPTKWSEVRVMLNIRVIQAVLTCLVNGKNNFPVSCLSASFLDGIKTDVGFRLHHSFA